MVEFNMPLNKIYTGIGSRKTPPEILELMVKIGTTLAKNDWTLRSGHADGADEAFERGARAVQGKTEIYLPWEGFNQTSSFNPSFIVPSTKCPQYNEALKIAAQFHPAWNQCSHGAKSLHTRNVYQVVGLDLNTPTDLVICWTKDGKRGGGTGQALRIAEYLKIPIFDLAVCGPGAILEFINHGVISN